MWMKLLGLISEVYLGPSKASMVEIFAETLLLVVNYSYKQASA